MIKLKNISSYSSGILKFINYTLQKNSKSLGMHTFSNTSKITIPGIHNLFYGDSTRRENKIHPLHYFMEGKNAIINDKLFTAYWKFSMMKLLYTPRSEEKYLYQDAGTLLMPYKLFQNKAYDLYQVSYFLNNRDFSLLISLGDYYLSKNKIAEAHLMFDSVITSKRIEILTNQNFALTYNQKAIALILKACEKSNSDEFYTAKRDAINDLEKAITFTPEDKVIANNLKAVNMLSTGAQYGSLHRNLRFFKDKPTDIVEPLLKGLKDNKEKDNSSIDSGITVEGTPTFSWTEYKTPRVGNYIMIDKLKQIESEEDCKENQLKM